MRLSGTPEQVMQGLADLIDQQGREHSALLDKVLAMECVLKAVSVHLIGTGTVTHEKWNELLETFATGIVENVSDVTGMPKEKAKARAERIRSDILSFRLNADSPLPFTVIKGGLED